MKNASALAVNFTMLMMIGASIYNVLACRMTVQSRYHVKSNKKSPGKSRGAFTCD